MPDGRRSSSGACLTREVLGPSSGRRRVWAVAAGVFVAAAALLVAVRVQPEWWRGADLEPSASPLAGLIDAVATTRTVEARLSGGFRYGPLSTARRSGPPQAIDNLALLAAAAKAQLAARLDPSPSNMRAWGLAQLLLGRYDEAVRELEGAAALDPESADLQSDLAAAYSARRVALDRPEDALNAAGAARRALDRSLNHPEAHFNLAFSLELLHLEAQAIDAWTGYVQIDPHSQWAGEVRSRIEILRGNQPGTLDVRSGLDSVLASFEAPRAKPLVEANPQEAREWLEEAGFAAWADSIEAGNGRLAGEQFIVLQAVVEVLTDTQGDSLLHDHMRVLESLPRALLLRAAAAHRQFATARRAQTNDRIGEALPDYQRASAGFATVSSPYRLWVEIHLSHLDQDKGDMAGALNRVRAIRRLAPQSRYPLVHARTLWSEALAVGAAERYGDVLRLAEEAAVLFELTKERVNQARMTLQAASALGVLGDSAGGWEKRLSAVRQAQHLGHARLSHVTYNAAASVALLEGFPEAAGYFTEEMQRAAAFWDPPGVQLELLTRRANLSLAAGQHLDAAESLSQATGLLERLSQDARFPLWKLDVELLRLSIPEQRPEALNHLAAHLALAEKHTTPHLIPLLLERAAVTEDDEANATVQRAIDLLKRHRSPVKTRWLRPIWASRAWGAAVGVAVALAQHGQVAKAIDVLEHFKLGTSNTGDTPRHALTGLGVNPILYFAEADGRLWCFVAGGGAHAVFESPLAAVAVAELARTISDGRAAAAPVAGRQLFDALVKPALGAVGAATTVTIVPDGAARLVPFAALTGVDGRSMVEQFGISYATSLNAGHPRSGERLAGKTALFVASDSAAADRDSRYSPLPGARLEVTEAAKLYQNPAVLTDAAATRDAVLLAMRGASLIHIATHATVNLFDPRQSALILSGKPPDSLLTVEDLLGSRLPPGAIVLVAGCSTAYGRQRQGEQHQSLIHGFLDAGAHAVLGSLWPLSDADSPQLMRDIHGALIAGDTLGNAVRTAQLAAIQRQVPPAIWGGLVAYTQAH